MLTNESVNKIINYTDRWYIAQIKPNGFVRANENLRKQKFETFMPFKYISIRHARQTREIKKPIFPGYIFINLGLNFKEWRKINSTFGVYRLISFQKGLPSPVPNELIDGLKARCDKSDILLPMDDLQIGEKVRLASGVFTNFIGEVEQFNSVNSVRLLFKFMGQISRIDVAIRDLERC